MGLERMCSNGSIHDDDSSMLPWRLQQQGRLVHVVPAIMIWSWAAATTTTATEGTAVGPATEASKRVEECVGWLQRAPRGRPLRLDRDLFVWTARPLRSD